MLEVRCLQQQLVESRRMRVWVVLSLATQLAGIPVLVLGNKNDLPTAMDVEELILALNLKAIRDREVCCYSISCKDRVNIETTLQWLIKHSKNKGK